MMRILHVVFAMNRGGMESRIMDLYRHIDRNQMQFDFLENTTEDAAYDEEILALGGNIFKSGYSRKNIFSAIKYVKNFFREHQEYTIVHVHESYLPSFNMIVFHYARKYGNRKIILHSRNASGTHPFLHRLLRERHSKKADYHFACSKKAAEWMFDKKTLKNKDYTVINNAIDAKKFSYDESVRKDMRKKLGLTDADIVLGHVGRFYEQKNHEFLIDIFKDLYAENNNYKLMLVGNGPLQENIMEKVREFRLEEAVTFLGVRKDMAQLYQAFDIFVLPSLYEGLPGVGVEAQAAGLISIFADTITDEVMIVPELCRMLPIDNGSEIWCRAIGEKTSLIEKRRDTYNDLKNAGFDVNGMAEKLTELYRMM